ncbi:MAG: divalent-cation tolerance protein CutA [Neisseriaceae bacterium]
MKKNYSNGKLDLLTSELGPTLTMLEEQPLTPSGDPDQLLIAVTTLDKKKEAKKLAKKLIESKLAACVQIIPRLTSYYTWEGKMQKSRECMLWIKTPSRLHNSLINFLRKNHPYQLPEILSLKPYTVSNEYLQWVVEQTSR